jgi:hypothetical protein
MEFNDYLNNCQEDDVLCYKDNQLHKIHKIKNTFQYACFDNTSHHIFEELKRNEIKISELSLFKDGVNCQILKAGSNGWQEGKLRLKVTLEFCPNEPKVDAPESPLDDIRQEMNKDS